VERKRIEQFEDLIVWQKGMEIVKQIYLITREGHLAKDFSLRGQVRRAALSITNNIAEGFERSSRKEYLNFLNIAKGSAGEVRSLLHVALEIGYLDQTRYEGLREKLLELSRFIANQIKSLKVSTK
jgi:four helix bundle protein